MLLFHSRKKTSNAQRLTSNGEMKESADGFGARRWGISRAVGRRCDRSGLAFSLQSSAGTFKKIARPHFSQKTLKLFRSDLERTSKDTTLSKKTITL